MVYTSIDHPKVPEIKGFQRGTLKISGWTLEKTEQGETMATHVIMVDKLYIYIYIIRCKSPGQLQLKYLLIIYGRTRGKQHII